MSGWESIQVLLSLILVIFIGFLIQQVNDRYAFIRERTKLPALIFVIISAGFADMHSLHPVFLSAISLLFAIYSLFNILNNPSRFPPIFNSGLFLGLAALFFFNTAILLPAFLIGIIILCREYGWREFAILITGFIVPFIFAISFAFYTDQLFEFFFTLEQNITTPVNHFFNNYPMYGYLAFLSILTIIASLKLLQQYDSRKVSSRKYYSVFLLIFIFSMISFIFVPAASQEMLIIAIIPVTYIISNLLVSIQSQFWSELLFILLLGVVIFMQTTT